MQSQKLGEKEAKQEITRFDTSRHEFIKRFFKAELEDPINYDLVINTQYLDIEAATSIIADAVSVRAKTVT
jgi:cytidylate kinase